MFKGLFKVMMMGLIFTALGCNISGTVKDGDGNPMEGVTITLTGAAEQVTTTDVNGKYQFTDLSNGSYTVTPTFEDIVFTPELRNVTIGLSNVTANFSEYVPPEPPVYDLTGNFLIKADSSVANAMGGGPVYIYAAITQTDNDFSMELVDYENTTFAGTIDGVDYTTTVFPTERLPMDFGPVTVNVKFKSLRFTAESDDKFTGTMSMSGLVSGLPVSDGNVSIEAYRQ